MSRDETLAALNVRAQTLYAYVSRGQVGRREDPADPRRSLYRGEDILKLVGKRSQGRRTASVAANALAWGEPVIPTTISTMMHGELVYRGRLAVELAEGSSLEKVAALLWGTPGIDRFPAGAVVGDPFVAIAGLIGGARPLIGRPASRVAPEAGACVARVAAAFGATGDGAMHERLARTWTLDEAGTDLVRRALVLLADHELNPSTFATRVAASTGASMPACIMAGLATLSGPRHGGAGAALARLVAETEDAEIDDVVARWLAAGHSVPGFGHPLYPFGDPRAVALLLHVEADETLLALERTVVDTLDLRPNIDFALLAISRSLGLPADACLAMFAIARTVGWAAHAMEQAASHAFIRPRARYEGPAAGDRTGPTVNDGVATAN